MAVASVVAIPASASAGWPTISPATSPGWRSRPEGWAGPAARTQALAVATRSGAVYAVAAFEPVANTLMDAA